jgi:hypothetical protein
MLRYSFIQPVVCEGTLKSVKTVLILFFLLSCNLVLSAAIPAAERQALIDLYNLTNGAGWYNKTNWIGAAGTENTWFGVTTDAGNTTVRELSLPNNNLVGTLPDSLGNQTNLRWLDLHSNELTGSIPTELGNLSNLQILYLNSNQLTGSIPPSLSNLGNLLWLYLNSNQLTGSIPTELGSLPNLQWLYLYHNQLTGSIPSSLGNLNKLQVLYLHSNELTGSIPTELGNLSNLQILYLDSNHLTGSIPPSLGNLSILVWLSLYNNQLTGSIPSSLGNLSKLTKLELQSNQLTGSIPASLTNLISGYLDIGYNALHTSDDVLLKFLNSRDYNWASTQTIAPTGVMAVPGSSSVTVSWTPIAYSGDLGGYRVLVATSPGGPYAFYAQTANKSASSQLVPGLTPGIPYYFVVQTRTNAHASNQNVVDSENSEEVWTTPLILPAITVTSPNGGENWIAGSAHNITWTTTGTVANIKLEYSIDSGANWSTISTSTTNAGTYLWTLPGTVSSTCLVRASEAATGTPIDVSDAVFSIVALTISGTVTVGGAPLTNVVMNGLPGSPVTNVTGIYTSKVAYNWTGTVTPTLAGYAFTPVSRSYTNVVANQTGQDYSALLIGIPSLERQALIDLYNSTNGDAWFNKTGWKTPPLHSDGFAMPGTENTWNGVTTNSGNTTVVQINLNNHNLVGYIPHTLARV